MAPKFERLAPVLPVRNVAAALEHYRRLGFAVSAYGESGPDGPIYGYARRDAIELHVTRVTDLDPLTTTSACYLYVDDSDAVYAEWQAQDLPGRLIAPQDTDYGLREMAHIDPDGNLLRVGSRTR